jgi:hypothetical protein
MGACKKRDWEKKPQHAGRDEKSCLEYVAVITEKPTVDSIIQLLFTGCYSGR